VVISEVLGLPMVVAVGVVTYWCGGGLNVNNHKYRIKR
jgi:hypothetical protein